MTKRLKVYLLIIFAAACLACTLVGCKIGRPGRDEILSGYDVHVTYYSNGGYFDGSTTLTVRELYFKGGSTGAPFFDIKNDKNTKEMRVERGAWDLLGWWLPARYEDGKHAGEIKYEYTYTYTPDENDPSKPAEKFDEKNPDNVTVTYAVFPVLDENGAPVTDYKTDRPVFAREDENGELIDEEILERQISVVCSDKEEDKVSAGTLVKRNIEDTHGLIVCAKWAPKAKICYKLVVTDEKGNEITGDNEYTTADGKEKFKNGDYLEAFPIAGEKETPQTGELKKLKGLTFVKTYPNADLTGNIAPISRPKDGKDAEVYCRYIVGSWTVVRNANDVETMFYSLADETPSQFFVINDIEYPDRADPIALRKVTDGAANAKIICDKPHTISGLRFEVEALKNGDNYSIFGTIGESFSVSDLTLKDVTISLPNSKASCKFYAICSEAKDAASENINLTIENITATYRGEPSFNGGNAENNWIFGCEGYNSDEAFLAAFTKTELKGNNTFTRTEQEAE